MEVIRAMSLRVISLTKLACTDPQQFHLVLKDMRNTMRSYISTSKVGTEEKLREALAGDGMETQEIDRLFLSAR
jgi:hypothetical protein